MVAEEGDALDELQAVDDVAEDAREEGHVAQQDAELRADQTLRVVLLLRAAHADGGADAGQLRVVGHEEGLLLVDGAAAAARVALEVAGDARLAAPALEHLAALVAEALLADAERGKVLGHLGRHVGPGLEHDAALDDAVHLQVEEEARQRGMQRRAGRQHRHERVELLALGQAVLLARLVALAAHRLAQPRRGRALRRRQRQRRLRLRRRQQRAGQQLLGVEAGVAHVGQQGHRIRLVAGRRRLEQLERRQAAAARVAQVLHRLPERVQVQHLVGRADDAVQRQLHGQLLLLGVQPQPLLLQRSQQVRRLVGARQPRQLEADLVEQELRRVLLVEAVVAGLLLLLVERGQLFAHQLLQRDAGLHHLAEELAVGARQQLGV